MFDFISKTFQRTRSLARSLSGRNAAQRSNESTAKLLPSVKSIAHEDDKIAGFDFTDLTEDNHLDIVKVITEKPQNAGAPPPPPPPPAIFSAKSSDVKSLGLTSIYWDEIKLNITTGLPAKLPPHVQSQLSGVNCIWNNLPHVELDAKKMESNFQLSTKEIAKKQNSQKKLLNAPILEAKLYRKIALCIKSNKLDTKMNIEKLKTICEKFEIKEMTVEYLEQLDILILENEELDKLQLSRDILGPEEKYVLELNEIPCISEHMKIWKHILNFDAEEWKVAQYLDILKNACIELEKSETFRVFLSYILNMGNFLRQSNGAGFEIKFIGGMSRIKSASKGQKAFLEFLVETLSDNENIVSRNSNLLQEFQYVGKISNPHILKLDEVRSMLEQMKETCFETNTSFDTIQQIIHEQAATRQKDVIKSLRKRVEQLDLVFWRVDNCYQRLLLYLGIIPCPVTNVRYISPDIAFGHVWKFLIDYQKCQDKQVKLSVKQISVKA